MVRTRQLNLFTTLAVATLAVGAWATSGNAQSVYQGKFTLPSETHWGNATLPAGNYTFTMASASSPYRLYVHGEAGNAIIVAASVDRGVVSGVPQLNLVNLSDTENVETFEAPELGLTFSYWTPKQKQMGHKEARQKSMPQTAPASQVSENRTSIQVQTAGR